MLPWRARGLTRRQTTKVWRDTVSEVLRRLTPQRLVTHRFPLREARRAIEVARDRAEHRAINVLLDIRDVPSVDLDEAELLTQDPSPLPQVAEDAPQLAASAGPRRPPPSPATTLTPWHPHALRPHTRPCLRPRHGVSKCTERAPKRLPRDIQGSCPNAAPAPAS